MNEPLVLTFDVGTQSVRALLFNKRGETVASVKNTYEQPYYSRHPNWAEQRADYYFEHICAVTQRLRNRAPEAFAQAVCATVTVFRDTTVCLGKNGKPLRDCILWMDQRQAKNPKPLPTARTALFKAVGMNETIEMLHRTSACNWIAENEPELWEKTDKYICLSTYINYRFTGRIAESDAGAIAKIPIDYKNRVWDKNGLTRCVYDIPQEKLCELVPSGSILGNITPEASRLTGLPVGMPVIAAGSDKGCETIGLSVIHEDQAALSFGTSCTIQFTSSKYFEPTPFMPSYPAVPKGKYNAEIQIFRGYWMLTWFKQNFAQSEVEAAKCLGCSAEELLNKHLSEVPAGSDGLLVLPHWTPGLATPGTRGAMIGFSDVHTRYHVYRAIIEGLNYALMDGLHGMEKRSGQTIRHLYLGGGGSRSDEICQITANMFGLPVSRIQTNESCALGAAICSYVTLGEFTSYEEAIGEMVHLRDTFEPDEEEHALYQAIYDDVYSKYYKTVTPLHRRLRELTQRRTDK